MPTYEYRREDGSTFEVFQKITDDPLETCPDTGQPVERLISGGQRPIFKGSGFYETDYVKGNGSSQSSNSNGSSTESADSGNSSSSSESAGSDE